MREPETSTELLFYGTIFIHELKLTPEKIKINRRNSVFCDSRCDGVGVELSTSKLDLAERFKCLLPLQGDRFSLLGVQCGAQRTSNT